MFEHPKWQELAGDHSLFNSKILDALSLGRSLRSPLPLPLWSSCYLCLSLLLLLLLFSPGLALSLCRYLRVSFNCRLPASAMYTWHLQLFGLLCMKGLCLFALTPWLKSDLEQWRTWRDALLRGDLAQCWGILLDITWCRWRHFYNHTAIVALVWFWSRKIIKYFYLCELLYAL